MTMPCTCHITLYLLPARKSSANTLMDNLFNTSGIDYFSTGISSNGLAPASAYCMGLYATDNQKNYFYNNLSGIAAIKWDIRDLDNEILDTNINPASRIGKFVSPDQSVVNAGFQFIEPSEV